MHTALLVAVKPLILLVFFLMVAGIYRGLDKLIPEGRVKRFLFKQRSLDRVSTRSEAEQGSRQDLGQRLLNDRRTSGNT